MTSASTITDISVATISGQLPAPVIFGDWVMKHREWGVPWTGVDQYADSLEQPVIKDGLMQPLAQKPGFGDLLNREWVLSQPHDDPQGILSA